MVSLHMRRFSSLIEAASAAASSSSGWSSPADRLAQQPMALSSSAVAWICGQQSALRRMLSKIPDSQLSSL